MVANSIKTGFAIARGKRLYEGYSSSKKYMIQQHCSDLGKTWEQCKQDGDYAVAIIIRWERKTITRNNNGS